MTTARRSIDLPTLLAIAASFAIGLALEKAGVTAHFSTALETISGGNPWGSLAAIYLITLLATELITNNAAAALMFPFALKTATTLGVSYMPFLIVVMIAASAASRRPLAIRRI